MKSSARDEIADPILYRTYFKVILPDLIRKLGSEVTPKNKELLHDFHKRILGYKSIAGRSHEFVSLFLFEVCAWWAMEMGIFVCTSKKQLDAENEGGKIQDRSFLEIKHLL